MYVHTAGKPEALKLAKGSSASELYESTASSGLFERSLSVPTFWLRSIAVASKKLKQIKISP